MVRTLLIAAVLWTAAGAAGYALTAYADRLSRRTDDTDQGRPS